MALGSGLVSPGQMVDLPPRGDPRRDLRRTALAKKSRVGFEAWAFWSSRWVGWVGPRGECVRPGRGGGALASGGPSAPPLVGLRTRLGKSAPEGRDTRASLRSGGCSPTGSDAAPLGTMRRGRISL